MGQGNPVEVRKEFPRIVVEPPGPKSQDLHRKANQYMTI